MGSNEKSFLFHVSYNIFLQRGTVFVLSNVKNFHGRFKTSLFYIEALNLSRKIHVKADYKPALNLLRNPGLIRLPHTTFVTTRIQNKLL